LDSRRPPAVGEDSEVVKALEDARDTLHALFFQENENLKVLKSKANQMLIGNGNTVVVTRDREDVAIVDAITLDYDQFKKDHHIHNPEDFLAAAEKGGKGMAVLFADYCRAQLGHLKHISVQEAMETIGRHRGDQKAYIKERFNHLFRLSSALWTFDKGKLNLEQRKHYDNIINFGVFEQEEGRKNFEGFVDKVKSKYQIRADHTYSTTGDPHRVWLLNFAAALPAFFVRDLERSKEKYLNEISPTYHIDRHFEMNVPDLFPAEETANRGLRAIGMAIVPGIDVIRDEKLARGHKFIFDEPDYIKENNHGQPFEWMLFRDMFDDIVQTYNAAQQNNLLDVLIDLLRKRVEAIPQDRLHAAITNHADKLDAKLASRDFSRLSSARLTHSEIKELRLFLDLRGYDMKFDNYIEGKLV
jgi:hypothetical protein